MLGLIKNVTFFVQPIENIYEQLCKWCATPWAAEKKWHVLHMLSVKYFST